jgi:hypothetical protein
VSPGRALQDLGTFVLGDNAAHIGEQCRFWCLALIRHGHNMQRYLGLLKFLGEEQLMGQLTGEPILVMYKQLLENLSRKGFVPIRGEACRVTCAV